MSAGSSGIATALHGHSPVGLGEGGRRCDSSPRQQQVHTRGLAPTVAFHFFHFPPKAVTVVPTPSCTHKHLSEVLVPDPWSILCKKGKITDPRWSGRS